jgi:sec-independent protein translocase protein TatC
VIRQKHKKQTQQTQPKKSSPEQTVEQTFLEHLYEVRKRLFWVVLVMILVSAIGFQFKDALVSVTMAPLQGQKLVYLTPGGGFSFIFTLCLYFGVLFTIPVAVYHVFRFLQPIIGNTSRKFISAFLIVSTLLAASGALFGYFVTIPAALNFLSTFAGDAVSPNLTADSYLSFVVAYIVGLALIFQLPLLLFIIDHVHPFPPGGLIAAQRYVIIGATVLAAVITPTPDAFNMAVVGAPIIAVYEVGSLSVFVRRRVRRKQKVAHIQPINDEPLADIIKELENAEQEAPQPAKPAPVLASSARPIKMTDGFVARPPQAVPKAPQPQQVTYRPTRSMDGFGPRSRSPAPARVAPQPTRPNMTRVANRQFRSVDGFSTVS